MLLTIQVDTDKYTLVPKEPTEAMLKAGYGVIARQNGLHQISTASEFIWEAMIEASPCLYPQKS